MDNFAKRALWVGFLWFTWPLWLFLFVASCSMNMYHAQNPNGPPKLNAQEQQQEQIQQGQQEEFLPAAPAEEPTN